MPTSTNKDLRREIDEIRRRPSKELLAFDKRTQMTELVLRTLDREGSFFNTMQGGLFYFQNKPTPKLFPLEHDSMALAAFINEKTGINAAEKREFEHLFHGLECQAFGKGQSVQVHSLSHYDRANGNLYVSRFDGWMYKLDGVARIKLVRNGTDGVFFCDVPGAEPFERMGPQPRGLFQRMIVDSANFTPRNGLSADDQRWLFRAWLLSHFFGSLHPTKPLLLICGEKGGGKSFALRKWLKLLFGERSEVTGLEKGKSDGFVATICSQPIAVFDNVDEHISWLPDHLAQIATGMAFSRRKYYTTNEQTQYKPNCFVALTSRTPKFIDGRDDVLDRTLVLQTERRPDFIAENTLLTEIQANRNRLWTELLQELNRIVGFLREQGPNVGRVTFRMADFANFAITLGKSQNEEAKIRRILTSMENRQTEFLLAEEPIYLCLMEWLEQPLNVGRDVTSGELHKELSEIAVTQKIAWPYPSGHSLGQRLKNITTNLRAHFEVDVKSDRANQNHYRFSQKTETVSCVETENLATQLA